MLRLADRVMRQLGDLWTSLRALGEAALEVEGVLDGVGVLSDSSESLTNCDLPLQILNTIGGFVSGELLIFLFEFATGEVLFSDGGVGGLFEAKNFLDVVVLLVGF